MSINILTEPQDPPVTGDYTRDQAIQHSNEVPMLSILSDWESVAAAPLAKQGAFIRHAGNTFQVQTGDEPISGSPAAGLNYIIATESAGVITLAWATSISGFSYNPAYGGIYHADGRQLLRDICYLDGTDYNRGMGYGEDQKSYRLADGKIISDGDILASGAITAGGPITAGGSITTETDLIDISITSGSGNYFLPAGIVTVARMSGTSNPSSSTESQLVHSSGIPLANFGASASTNHVQLETVVSDGANFYLRSTGTGDSTTFKIYVRKLL